MFNKVRARYASLAFGRRKFPQKPRTDITVEDIIDQFTDVKKIVVPTTKVSSIGSCFAEEILLWMKDNNFNVIEPKWGMVYNPINIRLIVEGGLEYDKFNPAERYWDFGDGDIRTPYIKSSTELSPVRLGTNLEQAKIKEAKLFSDFGKVLRNVKLLLLH